MTGEATVTGFGTAFGAGGATCALATRTGASVARTFTGDPDKASPPISTALPPRTAKAIDRVVMVLRMASPYPIFVNEAQTWAATVCPCAGPHSYTVG